MPARASTAAILGIIAPFEAPLLTERWPHMPARASTAAILGLIAQKNRDENATVFYQQKYILSGLKRVYRGYPIIFN